MDPSIFLLSKQTLTVHNFKPEPLHLANSKTGTPLFYELQNDPPCSANFKMNPFILPVLKWPINFSNFQMNPLFCFFLNGPLIFLHWKWVLTFHHFRIVFPLFEYFRTIIPHFTIFKTIILLILQISKWTFHRNTTFNNNFEIKPPHFANFKIPHFSTDKNNLLFCKFQNILPRTSGIFQGIPSFSYY